MRRTGLDTANKATHLPRRPKRRMLLKEQFLLPAHHPHSAARRPATRIVLVFAVIVAVLGTGVSGFFVGASKDAATVSESTAAAGAARYASSVSADEALSQRIERINVQETVEKQTQTIDELQDQIENSKKYILDALMRNLNTKLAASRSSTGYRAYISQAKVLVSLNNKIIKFRKTEYYKTIDIGPYSSQIASRLSHIPTLRPIPGSYGGYGWRIHPVYGYRHFHPAVDVGAASGTSIKAAAAGTVTFSQYSGSGGNIVILDHGNGFKTLYMHCRSLKVKVGQAVKKGQVIATVGNTGTSTTSHLHFEVHYHGTPFNPLEILMQW